MTISENIKKLYKDIPPGIKIVAVSKTRTNAEIMQLYSAGHKILGENKVQELLSKKEELPDDIEWHMVGHLQSNKVKFIVQFVSLIHSVDSLKLLRVIDREASKSGRVVDCLLQVHIAREESKYGFSEKEITGFSGDYQPDDFPGLRIRGLMGMATFTGDTEIIRSEFRLLRRLYDRVKSTSVGTTGHFNELSMGMSDDYMIAIEEGSTIVRIGSLIFGERGYR